LGKKVRLNFLSSGLPRSCRGAVALPHQERVGRQRQRFRRCVRDGGARCADRVVRDGTARHAASKHDVHLFEVDGLDLDGHRLRLGQLYLAGDARLLAFNAFETAGLIVWTATKQALVHDHLLERVSSLDWLISTALMLVSCALAGPIAGLLGTRTTLVCGGVLGSVIILIFLFLPAMRDGRASVAQHGIGRERLRTDGGRA
jgi:hypothetical protein